MKQPETINIKVNGDDAELTTLPHVAFRILKACTEAGLVVETKERGQFRPLPTPERKAA